MKKKYTNSYFYIFSICDILSGSEKLLKEFNLKVERNNFETVFSNKLFFKINFKNISIHFNDSKDFLYIKKFLNRYIDSIETLEFISFEFKDFNELSELLLELKCLKNLKFNKCNLLNLNTELLNPKETLKEITFIKCNENIFKVFTNQKMIEKITVGNNDWTWNGFPHNIFNEICKNSKNLYHLVLIGAGTGSYFDCDYFPYKIKILETTMITFHWYVGIRTPRIKFLESQKGSLQKLIIHQLPFDFDGEKVLKYIIEEMNLKNFYYGKIPLILNHQKQEVKEFEASEIQITSAFEMVKQFVCYKFTLRLSKTDIASDEIERKINPPTDVFKDIIELEIIDESSYRRILGVFLGLYKNMNNIKGLALMSLDRNINVILDECLPSMKYLEEIYLTSTAPKVIDRLHLIKNFAPKLKKLSIFHNFFDDAITVFGNSVEINKIN